jgi:hypothetical protein
VVKLVKVIAGIAFMLFCGTVYAGQQAVIGPDTLLMSETNISQLPFFTSSSVASLQSSYDRTGGNTDYGNYVSTSAGTAVLADLNGPGAVVRIWSANPQGTLRIYIDKSPIPSVELPFSKLFDNSAMPFINPVAGRSSGGFYSYVPITFASHCLITVDQSAALYYQITSISYPQGTAVRSFSLPFNKADESALAVAALKWFGLTAPPTLTGFIKAIEIPSGKIVSVGTYKGSKVITSIRLKLPDVVNADLRKVILRMYFDGHKTPDVEAPVADFFGNAYGRTPFKSFLLTQSLDGSFEADFPMAFGKSANITLENGTGRQVTAEWSAVLHNAPFDTANEGWFHAGWNSEYTVTGRAHRWASVAGQRGKLVGIVQTMDGPGGLSFLEGDDQIRVDNQTWTQTPQTPTTVIGPWNGTGTEDCFNSGWYFSGGTDALPMNGALVRSDKGMIDCYRWFINDAPEFQSSLDAQVEHGEENTSPNVYYSSVAYWYSSGPMAELKPFPKANTITPPAP